MLRSSSKISKKLFRSKGGSSESSRESSRDEPSSPNKQAETQQHRDIVLFASSRPGASRGVVFGLRSQDCFAVNFPANHWKRGPRPDAVAYDLEPFVTIDAESMLVDVIRTPEGWIALAANALQLEQAVTEARQRSEWAAAVCPMLMLAIQKQVKRLPSRGKTILIWQSGQTLDWVEIRNRTVCQWRWLEATTSVMRRVISTAAGDEEPIGCVLVNMDSCIEETIREEFPESTIDSMQLDLLQEAQDASERIILGFDRPSFNLHLGHYAQADAIEPFRRPLLAVLASLSLLLAVAICVLLWRANQNERQISRLHDAQGIIFTGLFPDQPVPVGLLSRLESEHRQLLVTRGRVHDSPVLESVLPVLHAFLSGSPTDKRFRWDRIEFAPQRVVQAIGVAKSFADYEAVGESLGIAGFEIPPLSTAQVSGGVSMRLENVSHRSYSKRPEEVHAPNTDFRAIPAGGGP